MRTRKAIKGDECRRCHAIPFVGETMHIVRGGVECAPCRDQGWEKTRKVDKH